jgi:predicted transcriptional regulator
MEALSRRERQILDILYARGQATAGDVQAALPDPPSYSATRALLRILEEKGHVKHETDGVRYLYSPRVARERARRSALDHLVRTFFSGSTSDAVVALLGSPSRLSDDDLDRIEALIDRAKKDRKR